MTDIPTPGRAGGRSAAAGWRPFLMRLHFYIGLLVGPFILIAAVTGTLYVVTPQIETALYTDALFTPETGPARPLAEQAAAGRAAVGEGPRLFALRPAPESGMTTRVMFTDPSMGESESRAIFVDPVTLEVRGDMIVYGTSGILPFRTALDYLHRNLMLGNWGRYYSELAASWLWVAVVSGLVMWSWRPARSRPLRQMPAPQRLRQLHSTLGLWIAAGLLFLSATGLTWSQLAGGRIDAMRGALGWVTPSVSLSLEDAPAAAAHHDHGGQAAEAVQAAAADPVQRLDAVAAAALAAGIDSPMFEIRPPRGAGQAWMVREYDRSWPTQVDTIALHPETLEVTSRADFRTFGLIPKLIRWGIDAHMGILFGLPNQILMAALGIALTVAILYGYRIWWSRRPAPGALPQTLVQSWLRMGLAGRGIAVLAGAALGWALPLIGLSLLAFLAVDILRWWRAETRRATARG